MNRRYFKKQTPEIRQKHSMAARARKLKSPVVIPFTRREIINRDGLNCYLCGVSLDYSTATIDHVIPLSKGGFHCPNNAKIACLKCNQTKGSK